MENSAAAGPRGERLERDTAPRRKGPLCPERRKGSNGFHSFSGILSYFDLLFLNLQEGPQQVGFPAGSVVKNPMPMWETEEIRVPSLGLEDPLLEEMATYSCILAWKILWIEESGRSQSVELQRIGHN